MQTLIWHFDLFPESRILIFPPNPSARAAKKLQIRTLHIKAQQKTENFAKWCNANISPHHPSHFYPFVWIYSQTCLCQNFWAAQSLGQRSKIEKSMGGFSHQKKEKKPQWGRKCRKCSHELSLGWRDVQPRWTSPLKLLRRDLRNMEKLSGTRKNDYFPHFTHSCLE